MFKTQLEGLEELISKRDLPQIHHQFLGKENFLINKINQKKKLSLK
jgi:hypothetical protein